jgi:SAM-dependent methyltransferase
MTQRDTALPGEDPAANREQHEYWTHAGARFYRDHGDTNEALFAPFGTAMLAAARLAPGERVLDVGCGHGTSTVAAAEQVTPAGRVVGVDISAAMLEPAREPVASAGLHNVELLQADAQVHPFDPVSFDAVISRFGMMFFEDPAAAFANLARSTRPGGRLAFVCWRAPMDSEWVAVALGAVVAALGRAPELGPPGAPGPFALADGHRLVELVTAGGFRDVALESLTRPVRLGSDVDHAAGFILSLPQAEKLLGGATDEAVRAAVAALRAALAAHERSSGVVLDATAWLATARA